MICGFVPASKRCHHLHFLVLIVVPPLSEVPKIQDYMLAAFLQVHVQTSVVIVQHVGPKAMTCWTNKLLSVEVVVKLLLLKILSCCVSFKLHIRYYCAHIKDVYLG